MHNDAAIHNNVNLLIIKNVYLKEVEYLSWELPTKNDIFLNFSCRIN